MLATKDEVDEATEEVEINKVVLEAILEEEGLVGVAGFDVVTWE